MESGFLNYLQMQNDKCEDKHIIIEQLNQIKKSAFRFETFKERLISRGIKTRMICFVADENKLLDRLTYNYLSGLKNYPRNHSIYEITKKISKYQRSNKHWFLRADVKDFFYNINHKKLLSKVSELNDSVLISFIQVFLKTPRIPEHWKEDINNNKVERIYESGIPQGAAISQALSNIYLNELDKKINAMLDPQNEYYFRYTDDICLLLNSKEKTIKIKELIESELKELDLSINKNKLRLDFNLETSFDYLGFQHTKEGIRLSKPALENIRQNYFKFYKYAKEMSGRYLSENENKPNKIWRNLAIKINSSIRGYNKIWTETYTEENVYGLARHLSIVDDIEQIIELQKWLSGVSKYFCYRICKHNNLGKTYIELDSILNWYFRYRKDHRGAIKLAYKKYQDTRVSMPEYFDQDIVDYLDDINKKKERERKDEENQMLEAKYADYYDNIEMNYSGEKNENEYIYIRSKYSLALTGDGVYYDENSENWMPILDDWRIS